MSLVTKEEMKSGSCHETGHIVFTLIEDSITIFAAGLGRLATDSDENLTPWTWAEYRGAHPKVAGMYAASGKAAEKLLLGYTSSDGYYRKDKSVLTECDCREEFDVYRKKAEKTLSTPLAKRLLVRVSEIFLERYQEFHSNREAYPPFSYTENDTGIKKVAHIFILAEELKAIKNEVANDVE